MKTPFKQNMGMFDRMIRICLGVMLIVLGTLIVNGIVGIVLLIVGVALIIIGLSGFCPTYVLLGVSTKREVRCC